MAHRQIEEDWGRCFCRAVTRRSKGGGVLYTQNRKTDQSCQRQLARVGGDESFDSESLG